MVRKLFGIIVTLFVFVSTSAISNASLFTFDSDGKGFVLNESSELSFKNVWLGLDQTQVFPGSSNSSLREAGGILALEGPSYFVDVEDIFWSHGYPGSDRSGSGITPKDDIDVTRVFDAGQKFDLMYYSSGESLGVGSPVWLRDELSWLIDPIGEYGFSNKLLKYGELIWEFNVLGKPLNGGNTVPEPAGVALLSLGLFLLSFFIRRNSTTVRAQ